MIIKVAGRSSLLTRFREQFEVEYRWLLIFDPANSQLPLPSENAKPLPPELARKSRTTAEDPKGDQPKADQPFCDPQSKFIWSEFNTCHRIRNPAQVKIDFSKPKTVWFYLGRNSTDARAQYTADLAKPVHDPASNFLDTVKPAFPAVAMAPQRRSFPASYPSGVNIHALNAARANAQYQQPKVQQKPPVQPQLKPQVSQERPYNGKYAITDPSPRPRAKSGYSIDSQALFNQRTFTQNARAKSGQHLQRYGATAAQMSPPAPMAPMAAPIVANSQRELPASYSQYGQPSQYGKSSTVSRSGPLPFCCYFPLIDAVYFTNTAVSTSGANKPAATPSSSVSISSASR